MIVFLHRLLVCLLLVPAGTSAAVTVAGPHGNSVSGAATSVAMVEGRPAVAWADSPGAGIHYARAEDATGAVWGEEVLADPRRQAGTAVVLRVVNGRPAICYFDEETQRIQFVRAADATGTAWGAPVTVPGEPGLRWDSPLSMEVADGNPAVCFLGVPETQLHYVRAANADGTAWTAPVTVDASMACASPSMKIVEGRPAIAYHDDHGDGVTKLQYCRALDAAGTAWATPQTIAGGLRTFAPHSVSMEIVNGRPAVAWLVPQPLALSYVRAVDATGGGWSLPAAVEPVSWFFDGSEGTFCCSLGVIQGVPAIGFHTPRYEDLKYAFASNSDGGPGTAWTSVTVDSEGLVGVPCALLEVNGEAALAYHDANHGSLKYMRSLAGSGGHLWPPDIAVYRAGTRPANPFYYPDGEVVDFGRETGLGSSIDMTLEVFSPNTGSGPLTGLSVTIDGPDAADFSIPNPLTGPLPGGSSTGFTVRYAPLTKGIKRAMLHIASNVEGGKNPYDLALTASTGPDMVISIFMFDRLYILRDDGEPTVQSLAVRGEPRTWLFALSSMGTEPVENLAVTIDGPDAAEFSILIPPEPVVARASETYFNIRHLPATSGRKSATLHVSSNISGFKNPYDLPLLMLPGLPDPDFSAFNEPTLFAVGLQGDGTIVTGSLGRLEAFKPDGSPDAGFFAPFLNNYLVNCLAVQKDRRILTGGTFLNAASGGKSFLRFLPDGTRDAAFAPDLDGTVDCLTIQPDGKILAGGLFTVPGLADGRNLARFDTDGALDASFNPRPADEVYCLALQPDGKILAGGNLTGSRIIRLNPDGTKDASFATVFADTVYCLALQPDGRILAGGDYEGTVFARLFPDGALDLSAVNDDLVVEDVSVQADGTLFRLGRNLVRMYPDGPVDDSFVRTNQGWPHGRMAVQADGGVVIAGTFLTRFENDPAFTQLTNEGRSTMRWLRGGSAPEVRDVTFDVKLSGSADWTRLGSAARISGGWELSGLALPASGQIRAQAYAGGSVMESVAPILTPLESWRLQFFNTSNNTGDAADDADPDHDGLTNFTEYAFGLYPVDRGSSALPEFIYTNNSLASSFTAPEGREDVLYSAESSPTMVPGTWSSIPDTGTGEKHVFTVPGASTRVFVRYKAGMR